MTYFLIYERASDYRNKRVAHGPFTSTQEAMLFAEKRAKNYPTMGQPDLVIGTDEPLPQQYVQFLSLKAIRADDV